MRTKRPRIKIERNGTDLLLELTALILTLTPIIYLLFSWGSLPETVPTHIDSAGAVDSWGVKSELLILPAVMLADFMMLSVLQRFPHLFNYIVKITEENAETQYRLAVSMVGWMNLIISGGMALLFFSIVEIAMEGTEQVLFWVMPVFMGSLFGSLGYFLWQSWKNR